MACAFQTRQRDRVIVSCAVFSAAALAWAYLLTGAGMVMSEMDMGGGHMMRMPAAWTPPYTVLVLLMWTVMMTAMMLPSAAPAILAAAGLGGGRSAAAGALPTAACFAAGYLAIWTAFSVAATLLQWALDRAGLLSDAMAIRSAALAGCILLVAGGYQLTSWKQTFLRDCRAPIDSHDFRKGARTAFATGVRVGLRCLSCCWALMTLMFVGGLMNVLWTAVLALVVLVEKTLARNRAVPRLVGTVLVGWGLFTLAIPWNFVDR